MHLNPYRLLLLHFCSLLLISCTVGPDFQTPKAPDTIRYTSHPLIAKTVNTPARGQAGKAQTFVENMDIPADWWRLFHSRKLDDLIRMGLAANSNVKAADAAVRVAQETLRAQIGNTLFPGIDALGSAARERQFVIPSSPSAYVFNLFNAALNLNYTIDLVGGTRRQIENLRAKIDYQQFQLTATRITLAANIVTTAVTVASLKQQIISTRALLRSQENLLTILQKQFKFGAISQEIVLTQQILVNQTQATLPNLLNQMAQNQHALSVLVGAYPSQILPEINLGELSLPAQLPVSLPSRLVRQRPDVLAAEAELHAASAEIGVATANLLPQFNLSASYGFESLIASQLFNANNRIWNRTLQMTQPVFHGGALLAERRAAIATFEQSAAQYRQTVLQALQNVADLLQAIEMNAKILRAQTSAEHSAKHNWQLVQKQYRLGGVDYLLVLNAQQQYQNALITRIQAESSRYINTAGLFLALGGGWWHKQEA